MEGVAGNYVDLESLLTRGFTGRQIDILTYLQQGHTLNDIAGAMDCSPETVKTHVKRMAKRLDANGCREVVGAAVALCVRMNSSQSQAPGKRTPAAKPTTDYPDLSPLLNARFSKRDVEVLDLVQRGSTDAQTARACGISVSAVKKHMSKMAKRLGASGRVETVSRAIAECRRLEEGAT